MTEVVVAQETVTSTDLRWSHLVSVFFILVSLSIVINYPGRLNLDTIDMLWQGQNIAELNDWHSPFTTFAYSLFAPVFGSPTAALVVQSALLCTLPSLWFVRLCRAPLRRTHRIFLALLWLTVCSTLIVLAGQILKDVFGICVLSLALSIFELRREQERPRSSLTSQLVIGACLIGFALIRPTAILPVLPPLLAYLFMSVAKEQRLLEAAKIATFLVAAVLCVFVTPSFLGARKAHPENTAIVFDLAGISSFLNQDLFSPIFPPAIPRHAPWECYRIRTSDPFFWGQCREYNRLIDDHQSAVVASWLPAILHHPAAYLEHRAHFAQELLSTYQTEYLVPVPPNFVSGVANNTTDPSFASTQGMLTGLKLWKPTISFIPFGRIAYLVLAQTSWSRGIVWIILLILLPPLSHWLHGEKFGREMVVLSVFGVANALTMVFVGPAAEARYLLPTWWCLAVEIMALASRPLARPLYSREARRIQTTPQPFSNKTAS